MSGTAGGCAAAGGCTGAGCASTGADGAGAVRIGISERSWGAMGGGAGADGTGGVAAAAVCPALRVTPGAGGTGAAASCNALVGGRGTSELPDAPPASARVLGLGPVVLAALDEAACFSEAGLFVPVLAPAACTHWVSACWCSACVFGKCVRTVLPLLLLPACGDSLALPLRVSWDPSSGAGAVLGPAAVPPSAAGEAAAVFLPRGGCLLAFPGAGFPLAARASCLGRAAMMAS